MKIKNFLKSTGGKAICAAAAALVITVIIILLYTSAEPAYRNISVSDIFGKVMTENGGKTYEAYKNMALGDGYALTTQTDSYTRMVLDGDKYMKLEQESRARFEELGNENSHRTAIRLDYGVLSAEITKPLEEQENFVVNTPNAVLAVRGTYFRADMRYAENGDAYTDVYAYGGTVACHRIMPDGTEVDEEVLIGAGYKARIKMDEIITVYVEELIE